MSIPLDRLTALNAHRNFKPSKTQESHYRENGSPEDILQYVRLPGKTYGEKFCEQIAREHFNLDHRQSSTHDHRKLSKTIEQKSARFGGNGAGWKWQHIEMSHPWDYLLVCGLNYLCFEFYISSRKNIEELIRKGVITGQGKKDANGTAIPQQAYWFEISNFDKLSRNDTTFNKSFTDYFTHLTDEESLIRYIQSTEETLTHIAEAGEHTAEAGELTAEAGDVANKTNSMSFTDM